MTDERSKQMTDRRAQALKCDPAKAAKNQCDEFPCHHPAGFYLAVYPSGKKSWILRYRFNGKPKRLTLGNFPRMALAEARKLATDALDQLDKGTDPAEQIIASGDTVGALAEQYIAQKVMGQRTAKNSTWMIRKEIVGPWKTKRVADVSIRDVTQLLDAITERGHKRTSNAVRTHLIGFWKWMLQRGIVTTSPVRDTARNSETSRERVLNTKELAIIWHFATQLRPVEALWLQTLMLTGQRRTEVAQMKHAELDLNRGIWSMPPTTAKMGAPVEVPLTKAAVARIKRSVTHIGCPYVFTMRGATYFKNFVETKLALDDLIRAAGYTLADWTFHDFRRSLATVLVTRGVPLHIADLCLSHSRKQVLGSVTAIYQRYSFLKEKAAAMQQWADFLEALELPEPGVIDSRLDDIAGDIANVAAAV